MLALNRWIRRSVPTTRGIAALLSLVASILPAQPRLAIVNVTVIDATGSAVQRHKTVLIAGDRIDAVVDATAPLPKESRIIRGDGKFLIPGLWDMHVHLTERDLPVLVSYGVTGVRDMGNVLSDVDVWRGKIAAGGLVGPHIRNTRKIRAVVLGGRLLDRSRLERLRRR